MSAEIKDLRIKIATVEKIRDVANDRTDKMRARVTCAVLKARLTALLYPQSKEL